jgi:hypothetical protein
VILLENIIVQKGLQVLLIGVAVLFKDRATVTLRPGGIGKERRCNRERNALYRTYIGFAAYLHGTIFDQDVGPEKRIGWLQVCLKSQAKDGAGDRIDGDLSVIAGKLLEDTAPAIGRDTAELYIVM